MMEKIKVVHTCNSRIRIQISEFQHNRKAFDDIGNKLHALYGIQKVRSNPTNACIILNFNQELIGQTLIVKELNVLINAWLKENQPNKRSIRPSRSESNPLLKPLLDFLGISLLGLGVLLRPLFSKKILIQTPTSALGLLTMVSALPLLGKLIKDLRKRRISSETILDISVYATIMAGETLAAIEILWITHAGVLLQTWVTEQSRRAISRIAKIGDKNVFVIKDDKEIEVPASQINVGDRVKFFTGDRLSVDGFIEDGFAEMDESSITGRSDPLGKSNGNHVFAGSLVYQGEILVRTEQVGDQTYLARIFHMVENALEDKAEVEEIAEQLANQLMKIDLVVTISTFLLTRDFWRSFSVMIVMACPCATILAASTAITSALYLAARNHVLIKGGRYLETLRKIDTICFDKTGTLTTSEPFMSYFCNMSDMDDSTVIQLACSAEIHSNHPLAFGFKKLAMERNIDLLPHRSCQVIPGNGLRAMIQEKEILVGNQRLMERFDISINAATQELDLIRKQLLTPVFIGINQQLVGLFGFDNRDRENIRSVVHYFRQDGFQKIVMITGDSEATATAFCNRYGFDDCYHSVLPENKADIIKNIQSKGKKVLMVGDGINDSLALAAADIGIAMGAGGSEVAVEAADIALVDDDLRSLVFVRSLSHETLNIIYQNFWLAVGSDIAGVALGALGYLSPLMAGSFHILHTLGILGNSSRILFFKGNDSINQVIKNSKPSV